MRQRIRKLYRPVAASVVLAGPKVTASMPTLLTAIGLMLVAYGVGTWSTTWGIITAGIGVLIFAVLIDKEP